MGYSETSFRYRWVCAVWAGPCLLEPLPSGHPLPAWCPGRLRVREIDRPLGAAGWSTPSAQAASPHPLQAAQPCAPRWMALYCAADTPPATFRDPRGTPEQPMHARKEPHSSTHARTPTRMHAVASARKLLPRAHMREMHRDWAQRSSHICAGAHSCHICAGAGPTPSHICAGTWLAPATSAPGLGSPPPHLPQHCASCLCPAARSASPEIPSSHSSSLHPGAHLPTRSGNPRPSVVPSSSGIPVGDQGAPAGTSRMCGSSARGDVDALVSEPGGPGSFRWRSESPSHFDAKDAP